MKSRAMKMSGGLFAVLLCVFLLGASHVEAQVPASDAVASQQTSVAANESAITEYRLPPDKLAKAKALYETRVVVFIVGIFYGIALLCIVLFFRIGTKYRDLAERVSRRMFVQALIFAPLLLLTIDVLSLPLGVFSQNLRLQYGISVQSWSSWLFDWIKSEAIGTVIGTLVVYGIYLILRRSPKRWWLYTWLASIPFILLMVLIQPIFIDPLLDKFDSLEVKQPQLIGELEKVMQRGGLSIERSRMFEMQASEKLTTYNAYVTGIGASKRVVVWDNTSREMTIPETMFVFGHEQGHYVLDHIWLSLLMLIFGLLIAAYLAYLAIDRLLKRFGTRLAIHRLGDWASFPLLLLLFSVFSLIAQPISANISRAMEHEADRYGLEVIHGLTPNSSQVAAHAFQKLGEKSLTYPKPNALYVFLFFDHPPVGERVQFALEYRPWDRNAPNRYVD